MRLQTRQLSIHLTLTKCLLLFIQTCRIVMMI